MDATATERPHVPALDGVRGLAALLVMFFHFGRAEDVSVASRNVGYFAQFGWTGVDLFFVLSGFLIGGILLDSRNREHFLRTFYARRALRIFPLYYAFLALYIFAIFPALPGPAADVAIRQKWLWMYLGNFDVAWRGWYAGVGSHANNLWSLAIEEQFYLVAPFAVLLFSRRHLAWLATAGVVGSIGSRFALASLHVPVRAGYVLTFTRLDALSIGVLLAMLARSDFGLERLVPAARWVLALALTYIVLLTEWIGTFGNEDWRIIEFGMPVMTLAWASLLVLAVTRGSVTWPRRVFESRALRFFGRYSYGLYLWHPLVGHVTRLLGLRQAALVTVTGSSATAIAVRVVVKIAAATCVALVSYYIIERPFLTLKDRLHIRPTGLAPMAS